MAIKLKSIIKEHSIKLPEWVQLKDGTEVTVNIEPEKSVGGKRSLAEKLCGSWSGDPSIGQIFKEIEEARHRFHGRDIVFDGSS